MLNYPHPDNPQEVSIDFLQRLDCELPVGLFIAQPKLDGRRRVVHKDGKTLTVQAKNKEQQETALPLPGDIMAQLDEMFFKLVKQDNVSIDCEWIGLRPDVEGGSQNQELYALDILRCEGLWLRKVPFVDRLSMLKKIGFPLLPMETNPNLADFFLRQLAYPISEGIVVRRADSGLVLGINGCVDNPCWYKVRHTFVNRVASYMNGGG
jgi:ATP-dependent DNA ligase